MVLDRSAIIGLLSELGEELASQEIQGQLFVVEGAAMALAMRRDRVTDDIDAVFEPKAIVYEAARRIAARHGLPEDWLNDGVKGFMPGDDPSATTGYESKGLIVRVASPRYLFTMKSMAARVERDSADLVALYDASGFASVQEALDHVQATAPPALISAKTQFFVEEVLRDHQSNRPTSPSESL